MDDKTVKCYLSSEELAEYDIDYKDFIMHSEKAREVVQEIIEQAEEEVGYKPPKFAFDLQIMVLPDKGLILTFSEKEPEIKEGDQLLEYLREMKQMLQKGKNSADEASADGQLPKQDENAASSKAQMPMKRPEFAVFVFSTLGKVMEFARALPANLRVESALYEMNGYYYLYFLKGHASYERYSKACIQALEFAALYTAEEGKAVRIKEHGSCLIAEKAVKKLHG